MTTPTPPHDEEVEAAVASYRANPARRKAYFKKMAALGFQQIEALQIAEKREDEKGGGNG